MIDHEARRAIMILSYDLKKDRPATMKRIHELLEEPEIFPTSELNKHPDISIPPGWELQEYKPIKNHYLYVDGKWVHQLKYIERSGHKYKYITQKIDIDLSKQPEELISFSMDENGEWWSFKNINPSIGMCSANWAGICGRKLFESEYPKNFTGNWKDSLLVRPEHWSNK